LTSPAQSSHEKNPHSDMARRKKKRKERWQLGAKNVKKKETKPLLHWGARITTFVGEKKGDKKKGKKHAPVTKLHTNFTGGVSTDVGIRKGADNGLTWGKGKRRSADLYGKSQGNTTWAKGSCKKCSYAKRRP